MAQYRRAAQNAKAACFDSVEIHSANGYLLDQFLQDSTNKRSDGYGGSIENRARLLMEVADAVIAVWGKDRVGVRLAPYGKFNDMGDSDPEKLFAYVLKSLGEKGVAYAHVIEPRATNPGCGPIVYEAPRTAEIFRSAFPGVLISVADTRRRMLRRRWRRGWRTRWRSAAVYCESRPAGAAAAGC